MAATAWAVHDNVMDYLGNKVIEFDTDSFIVILGLSTSNMTTVTVDAYASITNEVATNFGYTQGTKAMADPAWTAATGTGKWDEAGADTVWTASGGSITARMAAIYDDTVATPTADPIICSSSLSSGDITATDGNTFTLSIHASGIFTIA